MLDTMRPLLTALIFLPGTAHAQLGTPAIQNLTTGRTRAIGLDHQRVGQRDPITLTDDIPDEYNRE